MNKFVIQYTTGEYDDAQDHTVPFVYPTLTDLKYDIVFKVNQYIEDFPSLYEKERELRSRMARREIDYDEFIKLEYALTKAPYFVECEGYKLLVTEFTYNHYVPIKGKTHQYDKELRYCEPEIFTLEDWFAQKREY